MLLFHDVSTAAQSSSLEKPKSVPILDLCCSPLGVLIHDVEGVGVVDVDADTDGLGVPLLTDSLSFLAHDALLLSWLLGGGRGGFAVSCVSKWMSFSAIGWTAATTLWWIRACSSRSKCVIIDEVVCAVMVDLAFFGDEALSLSWSLSLSLHWGESTFHLFLSWSQLKANNLYYLDCHNRY